MKSTLVIAAMATTSILVVSSGTAHANDAPRKEACSITERGIHPVYMEGCLIDSSMFPQGRVGWTVTTPDGKRFRIEDNDFSVWGMDGRPAVQTQDGRCFQNDRVAVCLETAFGPTDDDSLCEPQKRALKKALDKVVSYIKDPAVKAQEQARFQEGMAWLEQAARDNVTLGARAPGTFENCAEAVGEGVSYLLHHGAHVTDALACSITDRGHPTLHLNRCRIESESPRWGLLWRVKTPDRRFFGIEHDLHDSTWRLNGNSAQQTEGGRCYQSNDVTVCVENGASWPRSGSE